MLPYGNSLAFHDPSPLGIGGVKAELTWERV
jgi:hypothetical protein